MRYKELLTEDISVDKMVKLIQRDCQPFLSQLRNPKKQILWRGMNGRPDSGKMQAHLSNRRPLDTQGDIHADMNVWFQDNYGHPYRNGVFVVGASNVASTYGEPYAIFPIGNFDFLWSKDIVDVYTIISDVEDRHVRQTWVDTWDKLHATEPDAELMTNRDKLAATKVGDVLDQMNTFQSTELPLAIEYVNEIMLWCKEYYYASQSYYSVQNIVKRL